MLILAGTAKNQHPHIDLAESDVRLSYPREPFFDES
jgi:hypothetical protein